MAILSKQIGWSQESNLLWEILKQTNKLAGLLTPPAPVVPPYKVFTALLSQYSNDTTIYTMSEQTDPFVIGQTYYISNYQEGDDFTNVGASANQTGVFFVATGTTAASWGNGSELQYNLSVPVIQVLENTLVDNLNTIYLGRANQGFYTLILNNIQDFDQDKTTVSIAQNTNLRPGGPNVDIYSGGILFNTQIENSQVYIYTAFAGSFADYLMMGTKIEIRVYN